MIDRFGPEGHALRATHGLLDFVTLYGNSAKEAIPYVQKLIDDEGAGLTRDSEDEAVLLLLNAALTWLQIAKND